MYTVLRVNPTKKFPEEYMASEIKKYCDAMTALMNRYTKYTFIFLMPILDIFPVNIDFVFRGCNKNKKNVQMKFCRKLGLILLQPCAGSRRLGQMGQDMRSVSQTRGFTFYPPPLYQIQGIRY